MRMMGGLLLRGARKAGFMNKTCLETLYRNIRFAVTIGYITPLDCAAACSKHDKAANHRSSQRLRSLTRSRLNGKRLSRNCEARPRNLEPN